MTQMRKRCAFCQRQRMSAVFVVFLFQFLSNLLIFSMLFSFFMHYFAKKRLKYKGCVFYYSKIISYYQQNYMFEICILKTTPEISSTKSCFVLFSKQSSKNLDMVQSKVEGSDWSVL